MFISLPTLIVGWVFIVIGIYSIVATVFGLHVGDENLSLVAIWAFLFSFGTISFAGILASKAHFASKDYLRRIYLYSIVSSIALFFGYLIVGLLYGAGAMFK